MIEGYLRRRAGLRAVVLLVDVRRGVEDEERQLAEFLRGPREVSDPKPLEVVLVATKVDKLGAAARKPALDAVSKGAALPGSGRVIGFSAVTSEGREDLWARVRRAALGSST
jgi:GTP-binding protein